MDRKAKRNERGLRKNDPPTDRQAEPNEKERKKTNKQTKEEMKD